MGTVELELEVKIDGVHTNLLEEIDEEIQSNPEIPFESAERLLEEQLSEASTGQIEQLIYDFRQQLKEDGEERRR
jgi:hypothetical protein